MEELNNKGLTLVELILAMAISVIIIGAITSFMSTSTRSYQSQESEISLQMEAQSIMNQIQNLIMEGNNINFTAGNMLTIYHTDEDETTFDKSEVIWHDSVDGKLYLYYITAESDITNMKNEIMNRTGLADNLLGEYVSSIWAEPDRLVYDRASNSGNTVTVYISMEYNNKTYDISKDIKLRNRVVNVPLPSPSPP